MLRCQKICTQNTQISHNWIYCNKMKITVVSVPNVLSMNARGTVDLLIYTEFWMILHIVNIVGAVVRLLCKNTKYTLVTQTKTDKNGYFFINAPKTITTYGSHKCKVFVVSSPLATCNKPTNLHYGVKGAILLRAAKPPVSSKRPPRSYDLFTVGPFAFEPSSKVPCPRWNS